MQQKIEVIAVGHRYGRIEEVLFALSVVVSHDCCAER